ncbi:MAG TPA: SDR family oxidoreductase [Candidatus Binatia bacterium]|nr:SDR family oxidoreductase [Candidatus Binatia bacterium]
MDLHIKGKRALVTGSSKGLGRAIAAGLAAEGVKVAICSRNKDSVAKTAAELGAEGFPCDLSAEGAVEKLVADVEKKLGGIDILVSNTGGPPPTVFDNTTDAMWHAGFESLFMSTVKLIRLCLPDMRQRKWGRIMTVTSVTGREPLDGLMISNAIRPGLHGLLNALSREVGKDGITVNALMPGSTLTDRLKDFPFDQEEVDRTIPAGRLGKPEDFGALATFLASEQAGYINGQAVAVDGGMLHGI